MACKVGVDKRYRPQPAPARWGGTYRQTRRNLAKGKIWSENFYSERHFVNYRTSNRLQQERITRAVSL